MKKKPPIGDLFIDSGAFTLYFNRAVKDKLGKAFYDTDEFKKFVRSYAKFLLKYKDHIQHYANVDVIGDPERSHQVLKLLERKYKLNPVPVIHCGSSMDWVRRYLDEGYEFIALGGYVGYKRPEQMRWTTEAFKVICDNSGIPRCRVHGFAMTGWHMMTAFPWWSVDSTSWVKAAGFGGVFVPPKIHGEFSFDRPPMVVKISDTSPNKKQALRHFTTFRKEEQKVILEWLEHINIPYGESDDKGERIVDGVHNHHYQRASANLAYFEGLAKSRPEWPWRWQPNDFRPSFGLV